MESDENQPPNWLGIVSRFLKTLFENRLWVLSQFCTGITLFKDM
jgi:hypothetical protein